MCGIFGAVSRTATQTVVTGLKRLEYRGYDSWGIAVQTADQHLMIEKKVGAIGGVESVSLPDAFCALGHTRWATHGGVSVKNAHPHRSSDGSFAVVQNGVIENYQELKEELIKSGYVFKSETDTEVIVGLIEHKIKKSKKPITIKILSEVIRMLTGRSTFAVITQNGELWASRNGSPLLVARSASDELFFSSDTISLSPFAHEYQVVENGQIVHVHDQKLTLTDLETLKPVKLKWQPLLAQKQTVSKGKYAHFMLKEIAEQPLVLQQVLAGSLEKFPAIVEKIKAADQVFITGAGGASYAAGQTAWYLRQEGIPAQAVPAYEMQSYQQLVTSQTCVIAISQSGETADLLEVIEWCQAQKATIVSLVNMEGSTLSMISDIPCMLGVGPEIGVASTKALTGQMLWGTLLSAQLKGEKMSDFSAKIDKELRQLEDWLQTEALQQQLKAVVAYLKSQPHAYILGTGQLYFPAFESALKLKEIGYLHAEAFSGAELKHGMIALIEKGSPVLCLVPPDESAAVMLNAAAEVAARGATVMGITTQPNSLFAFQVLVPKKTKLPWLAPIVVAQLLAYHLAVVANRDPDKPRNLAKSVTVK